MKIWKNYFKNKNKNLLSDIPMNSIELITSDNPIIRSTMYSVSSNVLTIRNSGKEVVRLTTDGSVIWNDEIKIDEAAEALSKSLTMSAEIAAGITTQVKFKIRDNIFNDLISIAKNKGPLTSEDLTYLLGASKIVEKLKDEKE